MDGKSSTLILCIVVVGALLWGWLSHADRERWHEELEHARERVWELGQGAANDSARDDGWRREMAELRAELRALRADTLAPPRQSEPQARDTSAAEDAAWDARRIAQLEKELEDALGQARSVGPLMQHARELEEYVAFLEGARDDPAGKAPSGVDSPFGPRSLGRLDPAVATSVQGGLAWLAANQTERGSWQSDRGGAQHEVGLTGLALLAFLGAGNRLDEGPHADVLARGFRWLREQQDPDTGLYGERVSHDFVYGHAIATTAVCEAYFFSRSPLLKRGAQHAVEFILRARNPYGAWRYDVPPIGDNDTSVTTWMVTALFTAKAAGLAIDEQAFAGARSWFDEVTDPLTGRIGYDSRGSLSSRTPGNDHFPRENGEAMTAAGLLSRFFLGQDPDDEPLMHRHAELLYARKPRWNEDGLTCDMYYWFFASHAIAQMEGELGEEWREALVDTALDEQSTGGELRGSWDPIGPWGRQEGRVYSTALMTLSLSAPGRYRALGD